MKKSVCCKECAKPTNTQCGAAICYWYKMVCGPGSSVGIATDYGLEDPGSNPDGDEIFRPS